MADSTEDSGETIERLRKTRPLKLETDRNKGPRLVARMVDQQHRRPDISSESEDDSGEDVKMVDGVHGIGNDDHTRAEDESESECESLEEYLWCRLGVRIPQRIGKDEV